MDGQPAHYQADQPDPAAADLPTLMSILTEETLSDLAAGLPPGVPLVVISVDSDAEAQVIRDFFDRHGRQATLVRVGAANARAGGFRSATPLSINKAVPPGSPAGALAVWVDRSIALVGP